MYLYFLCCRKIFKFCLGIDHYFEKYASKLSLGPQFGCRNDEEDGTFIISPQLTADLLYAEQRLSLVWTKILGGFVELHLGIA